MFLSLLAVYILTRMGFFLYFPLLLIDIVGFVFTRIGRMSDQLDSKLLASFWQSKKFLASNANANALFYLFIYCAIYYWVTTLGQNILSGLREEGNFTSTLSPMAETIPSLEELENMEV